MHAYYPLLLTGGIIGFVSLILIVAYASIKDKKQAIKALLNGEGAINMVVRRRKSLGGKVVTPLHINLSGHKGRDRGDG